MPTTIGGTRHREHLHVKLSGHRPDHGRGCVEPLANACSQPCLRILDLSPTQSRDLGEHGELENFAHLAVTVQMGVELAEYRPEEQPEQAADGGGDQLPGHPGPGRNHYGCASGLRLHRGETALPLCQTPLEYGDALANGREAFLDDRGRAINFVEIGMKLLEILEIARKGFTAPP